MTKEIAIRFKQGKIERGRRDEFKGKWKRFCVMGVNMGAPLYVGFINLQKIQRGFQI